MTRDDEFDVDELAELSRVIRSNVAMTAGDAMMAARAVMAAGWVSPKRAAAAQQIYDLAQTIKETGGAVEIGGVRIAPAEPAGPDAMTSSPATPASVTCPVCWRTSWHPRDVEEGYCGACHAYTSHPDPAMQAIYQEIARAGVAKRALEQHFPQGIEEQR